MVRLYDEIPSEQYRKCRYYPLCMIHTGEPLPQFFSDANVHEMVSLFDNGMAVSDIAVEFRTARQVVGQIIRDRKRNWKRRTTR